MISHVRYDNLDCHRTVLDLDRIGGQGYSLQLLRVLTVRARGVGGTLLLSQVLSSNLQRGPESVSWRKERYEAAVARDEIFNVAFSCKISSSAVVKDPNEH